MPRYYRRRYTRTLVKPKKKWATNLRNVSLLGLTANNNQMGLYSLLCANKPETEDQSAAIPTPTIIKTGNYKVQCDCRIVTTASALVHVTMYLVFVPEGVFVPSSNETPATKYLEDYVSLSSIITKHPEWILAWRQFGADQVSDRNNLDRIAFSSRLKRNLNSGDQVYAVALVDTTEGEGRVSAITVRGVCQFWTCNN